MRYNYACKQTGMEESLNRFSQDLTGRDPAIFLGAGVSEFWGIPSWPTLLEKLLQGVDSDPTGINPNQYLSLADYIQDHFHEPHRDRLQTLLHSAGLYFPLSKLDSLVLGSSSAQLAAYVYFVLLPYVNKAKKKIDEHFKKHNPYTTPATFFEGAALCSIAQTCRIRLLQGKRTIIITYNYDDTFEYILRKSMVTGSAYIRSYASNAEGVNATEALQALMQTNAKEGIDIFYVHGKLPFLCADGNESRPFESGIVLSSQSYNALQQRIIFFSNQIQYAVMTAFPIITLGFSGNDPNFRRLRKDLSNAMPTTPLCVLLDHCANKNCFYGNHINCKEKKEHLEELKHENLQPLVMRGSDYHPFLTSILQ